ncbi:ABC transporter ATP-binding protein [Curtobacterium herbarum]|uniref:ABC transporter ATP-binding protein n=1 Tax=Curtobacterium herbarum TaxID=150122 RepID=A0ABP4K029_9MICO|nr:ABC transporter ATP-binding protein [Curtobacterium herbarum]MBM7476228.1 peptide/nickel transport system ATP-binding protein [Curtobacterium herbarum]MCS6544205.1 ABC transporter ATP-binding protein [Curtobacterium herbarum]
MSTITNGSAATPTTSTEPILRVRDLHVRFPTPRGTVHAVRGVDLELRRGEVLGIVGESGSGKSVTSMAVLGLLPDTTKVTGSVELDGEELLGRSDKQMSRLRGDKVAMVFQDPLSAFTPVYTIGDQIAETVRLHRGASKAEARDRAIELLELVGIPEAARRVDAFPHEFSGGMRQRAMIAMAMANDPDVILADEPTTALDVTIQAQIIEVLRTAQRETGAALVFVSHDLGVIAGIADRIAVMYAGRIVETATAEELFARPRMPYTIGLIGALPRLDATDRSPLVPIPGSPPSLIGLSDACPFAARCPLVTEVCRSTEPALAPPVGIGVAAVDAAAGIDVDTASTALPPHAAGHTAACHRTAEVAAAHADAGRIFSLPVIPEHPAAVQASRTDREPVVLVEGLTKTFPLVKGAVFRRKVGEVFAVDGVDLDIRRGETLGLVGESGSGKSTTLHQLMDLERPESGTVELFGESLAEATARGAAGTRALRQRISMVFQDPSASLDPRMSVYDVVAEPLRAIGAPASRIDERVPELLGLVGLQAAEADRYPHEFSGGQRQRISIARALAVEPDLVVLDEPVSALDVSIQAGVLNLLAELKARLGLSYLFVSHDLSVIRHVADRVSVMYLGRTVEEGAVDEVFERPMHPYTAALMSAVPVPDPVVERSRTTILLPGDPPSPTERLTGCRFRSRCPLYAILPEAERRRCETEAPEKAPRRGEDVDHRGACHYPEKVATIAA